MLQGAVENYNKEIYRISNTGLKLLEFNPLRG